MIQVIGSDKWVQTAVLYTHIDSPLGETNGHDYQPEYLAGRKAFILHNLISQVKSSEKGFS